MLQREIDPGQAADIEKFEAHARPLPRRRARRGRLPGLPPEQRHLRPAPGRPQPDGAGQGPLRRRHARAARHVRPHRRRRTPGAGATSPPARTSSSTSSQLERVPEVLRDLASVGLTTREACGDTVRNVQGCHLAGACPLRGARHHPVGRGRVPALPAQPARPAPAPQVQDQLLGLRHRLRPGDVQRRRRHRRQPARSTTAPSSPASGCSSPAASAPTRTRRWPSRSSPPARSCCPRIEAVLRVFDHHGNRDNKLRARMKWLVDTLGFDELQRAHPQGAQVPARLVVAGRAASPTYVEKHGDAPAGVAAGVDAHAHRPGHAGHASAARRRTSRWDDANVVRGAAKGTVSAYAYARLGDITSDQFRALAVDPARARRRGAPHQPPELRVPRPHRGAAARRSTSGSTPSAWPSPAPSWPATSSPARRRHLQPRRHPVAGAWPTPSARALEEEGLAEVGGVRINISGCTNSCGQHHIADIGFFGAERRAHGQSAPGYQMLLGGYVGEEQIHFGEKALRLPAKNAPEAAVAGRRPLRRRARGRRDVPRLARPRRRRQGRRRRPQGPRRVPHARRGPDFYVDYGETGPYVAEIGESECAT